MHLRTSNPLLSQIHKITLILTLVNRWDNYAKHINHLKDWYWKRRVLLQRLWWMIYHMIPSLRQSGHNVFLEFCWVFIYFFIFKSGICSLKGTLKPLLKNSISKLLKSTALANSGLKSVADHKLLGGLCSHMMSGSDINKRGQSGGGMCYAQPHCVFELGVQ